MEDLKHMEFFSGLLSTTGNEALSNAKSEGKKTIGYGCFLIPQAVLSIDNLIPVAMRAPSVGSTEIASFYLEGKDPCEYGRVLTEKAIDDGYRFLDGYIGTNLCKDMNAVNDVLKDEGLIGRGDSLFAEIEMTGIDTEKNIQHIATQLREKVLNPASEKFGTDISDEALIKSVNEYNEISELIKQIGEYRKEDCPCITGTEMHTITAASTVCPPKILKTKLEETLEEIKNRDADKELANRPRILILGDAAADQRLSEIIESEGGLAVGDLFCYGSLQGRPFIEITEGEDILTQIVRATVENSSCKRLTAPDRIEYRKETLKKVIEEYRPDGIVLQQMRFCPHNCEGCGDEVEGIPVLKVERPYRTSVSGQLKIRLQTFFEKLQ